MLSAEAQLLILNKIKEINRVKDYQKRVDEFIEAKQKIISALYDDLDDILAAVDLSKPKQDEVKNAIINKVTQLSIAFDEDDQLRMDEEELIANIGIYIDDLYWYDRQILELYIKLGNYRSIQKATGIPYSSAFKTVQKVIKEIKQKIKQ